MTEIAMGLVVMLMLVGFIRLVRDPSAIWMLLVGMVVSAGLAVQVDPVGNQLNHTWLEPLQVYRAELYLAFGTLIFLGMGVHSGKIRLHTMPMQGGLMLAIQLLASVLRFYHEGAKDGATSLVFSIVTMTPILLLLPLALKEWDDWIKIVRVLAFAGFLWGGATSVQVVINHRELIVGWQNRFSGLLGNPQGCGLFMAPITVSALWLILNDTNRRLKPVWFMVIGMMFSYSLWTGSRTCVAVTSLGLLFVLYARLGGTVLFLPLLLGLIYGVFQVALALGLSAEAVERLGSSQDTRGLVWSVLLEDAMANPILGSGFKGTRANENSYLVAFGAYGVMGGALVLILTAYSFSLMMKVVRYRRLLPPGRKQLADLILGFNAMFFAGGMFEWFIISRLEGMVIYMLIFSVLTKSMLDKLTAEAGWRAEYVDDIEGYPTADEDSIQEPATT